MFVRFLPTLLYCTRMLAMLAAGIPIAAQAVTYPAPPYYSAISEGSIYLRPASDGTVVARLEVKLDSYPRPAYLKPSLLYFRVDGDSFDVVTSFQYASSTFQKFLREENLGVLPAQVKRVRFLTQTADEPVYQQAEIVLDQLCIAVGAEADTRFDEYEPIRIPLRVSAAAQSARPIQAQTIGLTTDVSVDSALKADVCQAADMHTASRQVLEIPGLIAGSHAIQLRYYSGRILGVVDVEVAARGKRAKATSLSLRPRGSYFLTASNEDVTTLLAQRSSGDTRVWATTDNFDVWTNTGDAPKSTRPVCRFFNQRVTTHFYSARADDCALLRTLSDWVDEGVAFHALLPESGSCPKASVPVFRLFSPALANHRYTRSAHTVALLANEGWVAEGVAFCSPVNSQ